MFLTSKAKFLRILLSLKENHTVYKIKWFSSEEHHGIIQQNKTEDLFHIHPRGYNFSDVCLHAHENITELVFFFLKHKNKGKPKAFIPICYNKN